MAKKPFPFKVCEQCCAEIGGDSSDYYTTDSEGNVWFHGLVYSGEKLLATEESVDYLMPSKVVPFVDQEVSNLRKEVVSNYNELTTMLNGVRDDVGRVYENIQWKNVTYEYEHLQYAFPNPEEGWATYIIEKQAPYIYLNGEWKNMFEFIPLASNTVDGKMSKEDKTKLDSLPNKVANALQGTTIGSPLILDDVSPIEHSVDVMVKSKNLSKNVLRTGVSGYLTLRIENNLLTLNGSATSNVGVSITDNESLCFLLQPGTYRLSAQYVGGIANSFGSSNSFYIMMKKRNENTSLAYVSLTPSNYTGTLYKTVTLTEATWVYMSAVGCGDFENLQYHIQVEEGTTTTPYTPYVENLETVVVARYGENVTDNFQNYPVNADGTVDGVTSLSPVMQLVPDNENVIIKCTYNKDSNKVIEKLTNAIISLGGNV